MEFLRKIQDTQAKYFTKGGPLERLYPLYEANDTFLFTPGEVTHGPSHVRDGIDLKRLMFTVVIALGPCMLMAMFNTGYQAALAITGGAAPLNVWQTWVFEGIGLSFNPGNPATCLLYGALFYIPVYVVTLAAGGFIEVIFAVVRKHEISEGFLVTSALFPLTLPATIPLWQVAIGIMFGVLFGKEVFGGVGMNFLNPALVARAFLFFAYPAQISGDKPWIPALTSADGYSGATPLAQAFAGAPDANGVLSGHQALIESQYSWLEAFVGLVPGSMGETSALFCIMGATILLLTGVGSWQTMTGCVAGSFVFTFVLNIIGSDTNPFFDVPIYWHWVIGSFAFATVFMATDPVSSAYTGAGKLIYGFCIGVLGILIRVINPAYPEGWMLAILFMNMFAPFIDHFIVRANVKRRAERYVATT